MWPVMGFCFGYSLHPAIARTAPRPPWLGIVKPSGTTGAGRAFSAEATSNDLMGKTAFALLT